jgi:hypothetical protein
MSGGPWFSIPRSSPVPADAPSARPGISGKPAAEGYRPFCRKKTRQPSPTQCLTSSGASAAGGGRPLLFVAPQTAPNELNQNCRYERLTELQGSFLEGEINLDCPKSAKSGLVCLRRPNDSPEVILPVTCDEYRSEPGPGLSCARRDATLMTRRATTAICPANSGGVMATPVGLWRPFCANTWP